ncbi:MAG: ABC transporter substrate-binding protein [Nitrospirae bacterium]|nr:ABC transporter substrate-binding protein [Nitrospirota bacterium]
MRPLANESATGDFLKGLFYFVLLVVVSSVSAEAAESSDLSKHPIYSGYDFGKKEKVINLGTQPLYIPSGVIGEVMKRDRTLKNSLKKKGWEVRFHSFLKGEDINYFIKRGDIDAAMAGDMPTIMIASAGKIVVTALAQQGFTSIIATDYMEISELKGARVGYPSGSNAYYAFLVGLSLSGLKETDVKMIPYDIVELPAALSEEKIDAFTSWEPITTISLRNYNKFIVIQRYLSSGYFYIARSPTGRHPDMAEALTAAFMRALIWLRLDRNNLQKAAGWTLQAGEELQGAPLGLSALQIAEMTRSDILDIVSVPFIPARAYEAGGSIYSAFEFLKKIGKIPPEAAWDRVSGSFDNTILRKISLDPRRYEIYDFNYEE